MKSIINIFCIALCFFACSNEKQSTRYTGFSIKASYLLMDDDTAFKGKIDLVFNNEMTLGWGKTGNDTILFSNGLIIYDYYDEKIRIDTGNFELFTQAFLLWKGKQHIPLGEVFSFLIHGQDLKWFKENAGYDKIVKNPDGSSSFIGKSNNEFIGAMQSNTKVELSDKFKRVGKVEVKIDALYLKQTQVSSAEIIDTFSIDKTFFEAKFNEYLLRYVKAGFNKPKDSTLNSKIKEFKGFESYPVKLMMNTLPHLGKLTLSNPDYYFVDYSYISCAPCKVLHEKLKEKARFLKDNNIEVIIVNKINQGTEISHNNKKTNFNYYTLYNSKENKDTLNVSGYPTSFLVDAKTSKVIGSLIGFSIKTDLEEWISSTILKPGNE